MYQKIGTHTMKAYICNCLFIINKLTRVALLVAYSFLPKNLFWH